ncbi:hypothetical protein OSTOST_11380, partial [Ostertagia ostertagi]
IIRRDKAHLAYNSTSHFKRDLRFFAQDIADDLLNGFILDDRRLFSHGVGANNWSPGHILRNDPNLGSESCWSWLHETVKH